VQCHVLSKSSSCFLGFGIVCNSCSSVYVHDQQSHPQGHTMGFVSSCIGSCLLAYHSTMIYRSNLEECLYQEQWVLGSALLPPGPTDTSRRARTRRDLEASSRSSLSSSCAAVDPAWLPTVLAPLLKGGAWHPNIGAFQQGRFCMVGWRATCAMTIDTHLTGTEMYKWTGTDTKTR
jgi:hypothetical protein